jgi:hypothetical protein
MLLASGVVAVAIVAIAFVLLGGSPSKVVDPVAQAATVSAGAPGYRIHMSMEISSSVTATPVTASGSGIFDTRDHAGTMSLAMNFGNDPQVLQTMGTDTLKMQEIIEGATVYMKLPAALASAFPVAGKQWIAIDLAKVTGVPGLSSLASNPVSSNPSDMLSYLRSASDSVLTDGQQRVDGVETTHYHADLNLARAADSLPSVDRQAAQQLLSKLQQQVQLSDVPMDVWIDGQHLVRRIEMTIAPPAQGGQTFDEVTTIDITHYGPEPRPALPPAGEVEDLSRLVGSAG